MTAGRYFNRSSCRFVSLQSIFWANNRPTSTEDETSTENSYYPKSETETEISRTGSEQPVEIIDNQIKNLELSKIELKSENRKLEYKIQRFQEKLAILTTENGATENSRIQLENELINCKSRNDQLESDILLLGIQKKKYQTESQEKQAQLEKYEKENNVLKKCKLLG